MSQCMQADKFETIETSEQWSKKKVFLVFTICFGITALGVFLFNAIYHQTLLWTSDGILQQYPKLIKSKKILIDILTGNFSQWSWDVGLGVDTLGIFRAMILSPSNWVAMLFPNEFIDLGYSIAVVLRMYFAGLAFLLFARKMNFDHVQQIAGALSYSFCSWILFVANIQGHFLTSICLFPLLILGIEKIIRKERPTLFIVIVCMQVIYSTYFAYMVAIFTLIYYLVRWFTYEHEKNIKKFFADLGIFTVYGILGLMLSGLFLLTNVYALMNMSTSSGASHSEVLLYSVRQYFGIANSLMTGYIFESYSLVAMTGLVLALLPLMLFGLVKKRTSSVMAILCLVLMMFPFVSSYFNGGSYVTGRWYFALFFFVVWAAVDNMRTFSIKNNLYFAVSCIWLLIMAGILVLSYRNDYNNNNQMLYGMITLVSAMIAVVILKTAKTKKSSYLLICVLMLNIIACNNVDNLSHFTNKFSPGRSHMHVGTCYRRFEESVQKVGTKIRDDDFYRIDQVEGISDSRLVRCPANENMYFGNKSVYTCLSTTDMDWYALNKNVGNNAGYVRRSYIFSNDNRATIDTLMSVKYFIGTSSKRSAGASEYAPYGFSKSETIDGVEVLKNKYSIGIGTTFDKCVKESDFLKLSYPERETLMQQAVVLSDEQYEKTDKKLRADPGDIKISVKTVPYHIESENGITVDDKRIKVSNKTNSLILRPDREMNGQIMVSFTGLDKIVNAPDLKESQRNRLRQFSLNVSSGAVKKRITNSFGQPQGFDDVEDYNANIGSVNESNGTITVSFDKTGDYSFDKIVISEISDPLYDENMKELSQRKIDINDFDEDDIKGSINAENDSLLFLSVPYAPGWKLFVDGKKTAVINNADYAFMAAKIDKGKHKIEIKYENFGLKYGWPVSLFALLIVIAIHFRKKTV